jgi:hypothetical protein
MICGHYVEKSVNTITSYYIAQRLFSALSMFRPSEPSSGFVQNIKMRKMRQVNGIGALFFVCNIAATFMLLQLNNPCYKSIFP